MSEAELPCVYEVNKVLSFYGLSPVIIIRRKPSDIPANVDAQLTKLAGYQNRADSYVAYEFMRPALLPEAERVLRELGWKRSEVSNAR